MAFVKSLALPAPDLTAYPAAWAFSLIWYSSALAFVKSAAFPAPVLTAVPAFMAPSLTVYPAAAALSPTLCSSALALTAAVPAFHFVLAFRNRDGV